MDDAKIIELFWARNENAITAISEKYGAYCRIIAKNILGNSEDAEECVNNTYLSAWNSIPPNKPEKLCAYLGKITRNLSLNMYKRDTAEKRGGRESTLIFNELSEFISDKETVEDEFERQELIKIINDFLKELTAEKRNIFICRYWYFDSISDIGARFKKSENNISVILNRLRVKLRDYLSERGYEL